MKGCMVGLPHSDELTLLDVLRILRRRMIWIIACGALVAAAMSLFTMCFVAPKYSAHTTMYIYTTAQTDSAGSITNSDLAAAESLAATYQQILQSDTVLRSVCTYLNANWSENSFTPDELADLIEVSAIDNTQLLQVWATTSNPRLSAAIANAFAAVGPGEILGVTKAGGVEIVDYGQIPADADGQSVLKNAIFGMAAGLLAACIGAFVWGVYDTRIYEKADVAGSFDISILAEVTETDRAELLNRNSPDTRKDAYIQLRTDLIFRLPGEGRQSSVILVTGMDDGSGNSAVAANLAASFAMLGEKTLLIDCDLRNPAQHKLWKLRRQPGLSDLLKGQEQGLLHKISDLSLTVLCAGSELPDPSEMLASRNFAGAMHYLQSRYEYIVLDAPSVATASDVQILAQFADGVLMTVSSGKTTAEALTQSLTRLRRTENQIFGLVINRAKSDDDCWQRLLKRTEKRKINA